MGKACLVHPSQFVYKPQNPYAHKIQYANAKSEMNELYNIFNKCKNAYIECCNSKYVGRNLEWIFSNVLTLIEKPTLKIKPIYELSYRVFECPPSSVDGRADCHDISSLAILTQSEKQLLCLIYDEFDNYSALTKYSNSKPKYYSFNGEKIMCIIRLYKKKSPNGPDHWHDVKLTLYDPTRK